MNDTPPLEAWFLVEVDVAHDRENHLFASLTGPFPTEEKADREKQRQQEAWETTLEERDRESPYDFKGWDVVKKHVSDHQIEQLERQDEESYKITMDAMNAVGASLLADEGIGPLAGDSRE